MNKKLLTVDELAPSLNVCPKTLYSWAELGKIPCYKLNGCIRFDPDEIFKWLESCKKEPSSGIMGTAQTVARPQERKVN
jgi:excisionase family DNA binding protein